MGFTFKLCGPDRAIPFENNPTTNNCEKHTLETTRTSEYFANFVKGSIRGGSVGCGHLNQWLAAVKDGAKTIYSKLCDPGKDTISTHIVTNSNEELKTAVQHGLIWFMVRYTIEILQTGF